MDFTDDFIEELNEKRKSFQDILSDDLDNRSVKQSVKKHWHTDTNVEDVEATKKYAVDGSRAVRRFSNGSEIVISRALMIGGDGEEDEEYKKTFVDIYRGPGNPEVTNRYERLVSHLIEIEVILDNLDSVPAGSVIYIDGSLYGKYLHSLWPLELDGREFAPFHLLQRHMELLKKAKEKDILLLGVAKTSQTRVLAKNILGKDVPDTELLHKNTSSPGHSTPVLMGGYGFASDEYKWLKEDPETFADKISTNAISKQRVLKTLKQLRDSTAIVTFHVRMERNHETMRVDVPAYGVGREDSIISIGTEQIRPETVKAAYSHVKTDYGGRKVYNSLLYTVDKMVRLKRETVDNVYLKLINDSFENDLDLEFTRSYQRFLP